MAARQGICAATRIELPARFLWRAYRQVLGRASVPAQSPLDKSPLAWRLMRLLPGLLGDPVYAPLARFLRAGRRRRAAPAAVPAPGRPVRPVPALPRRLARRLGRRRRRAGAAGAARRSRCRPSSAGRRPSGASCSPGSTSASAPACGRWCSSASWPRWRRPTRRPRRCRAASSSSAPATCRCRRCRRFAALAQRCQVLMAVPNPCRYHWADIIQGRELLRIGAPAPSAAPRPRPRRRAARGHAPACPSAARRLGRAGPRLRAPARRLRRRAGRAGALCRRPGRPVRRRATATTTLLQQVQARIRDLVPLAEHPPAEARAADRSIVFHVAHGALREVEILHDQLLRLLADPPGGRPLNPRDIIVMVPAIDTFAPAIEAVFGQHGIGDARHIPYSIADLKERDRNPLLLAVEWLLRLPQQRCTFSEVRSLLDVPAVAARFGLQADELPRLTRWMDAAGIRWGLNGGQRAGLGLDACGEQNTWLFGLRRMLLGYASGSGAGPAAADATAWSGIEPCAEVGGLEASIAGSLASLLERLTAWWNEASAPATPAQWAAALPSAGRRFPGADRRVRAADGALAARVARPLARSLRGRRLRRRSGAARRRPRGLAGRGRRAAAGAALQGRRGDLLQPAADALDTVRGGLPARHERRRLSALGRPQRLRPDGAARPVAPRRPLAAQRRPPADARRAARRAPPALPELERPQRTRQRRAAAFGARLAAARLPRRRLAGRGGGAVGAHHRASAAAVQPALFRRCDAGRRPVHPCARVARGALAARPGHDCRRRGRRASSPTRTCR